jgi:hypothetical protein
MITYSALFSSLSRERLAAYSLDSDTDSLDAVARYLWNMALASAIMPVLHMVEVAFRNAIYSVGVQTTAGRYSKTKQIPCWLDADPSFLEDGEQADVDEAIKRLGSSPRRRTPGHLVAQLRFGFWVRLSNRPYEHGRADGPKLWPAALKRFPGCPREDRTRSNIYHAFREMRDYRNLVAHHQPIWDRDPIATHSRALELLGWMNPRLSAVAARLSTLEATYKAGPSAYRPKCEPIITV